MKPLILASRSAARIGLLKAARVPFEAVDAALDEAAVKAALLAEAAPARDVADTLAELKAQRVAMRWPDRLVLAADQVLSCDGRLFDKPDDMASARAQLSALRGRSHQLWSAAVAYEDARPVWRYVGRADLVMRPFSDGFLDSYLETEGETVLACVGGYRIEDGGSQLFSRVTGDLFTIMGLPLLEVLAFLRTRGLVAE